jgi:hypothetical protein
MSGIEQNRNPMPILDELHGNEQDAAQRKVDRLTHGIRGGRVGQSGAGRPTLHLNADWSARKVPDPNAGRVETRTLGSDFRAMKINGSDGSVEVLG